MLPAKHCVSKFVYDCNRQRCACEEEKSRPRKAPWFTSDSLRKMQNRDLVETKAAITGDQII